MSLLFHPTILSHTYSGSPYFPTFNVRDVIKVYPAGPIFVGTRDWEILNGTTGYSLTFFELGKLVFTVIAQ